MFMMLATIQDKEYMEIVIYSNFSVLGKVRSPNK